MLLLQEFIRTHVNFGGNNEAEIAETRMALVNSDSIRKVADLDSGDFLHAHGERTILYLGEYGNCNELHEMYVKEPKDQLFHTLFL